MVCSLVQRRPFWPYLCFGALRQLRQNMGVNKRTQVRMRLLWAGSKFGWVSAQSNAQRIVTEFVPSKCIVEVLPECAWIADKTTRSSSKQIPEESFLIFRFLPGTILASGALSSSIVEWAVELAGHFRSQSGEMKRWASWISGCQSKILGVQRAAIKKTVHRQSVI
jgi:hypothetical protein